MIIKHYLTMVAIAAISCLSQAQTASVASKTAVTKDNTELKVFAPRYPSQPASAASATVQQVVTTKSGAMVVIDKLVPVVVEKHNGQKHKTDPEVAQKVISNAPSPSVLNLPLPETTTLPRKPQTQEMPGLGMMPGTPADYQIKSVRVGADRNEKIFISLQQLNKIATPFETPQAVDATGATLKAIGQDIFVKSSGLEPFTIYISDGGVGQSIGLTFVPQANLPAQSIVLVPDRPTVSGAAASSSAPEMVAPDYTGRLIGLAKKLALGTLPQGFTKSRLPRSLANDGKTIFEPQYKYSGGVYDIYSYSVKSVSKEPVELNEESFYSASVRAVAFYPHTMLQTNESTTAYIVVDRDVVGASK